MSRLTSALGTWPDPIGSSIRLKCENLPMLIVIARRCLAAYREPRRAARIARWLWIIWAVILWNVVFDHVIVVAGRWYLHAAQLAAEVGGPYARIDDWMRPAVTRGLWIATAAAGAVLLIGLLAVRFSVPRTPSE